MSWEIISGPKQLTFKDMVGDKPEDEWLEEQISIFAKERKLSEDVIFQIIEILPELFMNHSMYTPDEYKDKASICVVCETGQNTAVIISEGVINETRFNNLSNKVAFVQDKTSKDLFDIRNEFAWKNRHVKNGGQLTYIPEGFGSNEGSKGASMGILTTAAIARGPLTLERGENLTPTLFGFKLKIAVAPESPLKPTVESSSLSSAPHPPA